MGLADTIKERRLARMRLGQDAGMIAHLWSDQEVRVLLVPLTERENQDAMTRAAAVNVPGDPNSVAVAEVRDRIQKAATVWHALRELDDNAKKAYPSPEEMVEALDATDINYLAEQYIVMVEDSSPALDGLTEEALQHLRGWLAEIEPSELSGRSWRAFKLFHFHHSQMQLMGRSPGSTFSASSTGTSEPSESTLTAATSST